MNCQQIEPLLPDHLRQGLKGEQARLVEEHLAACSACSEEVELWRQLATLPQEEPGPGLRHRFNAMLGAYQQGRREEDLRKPAGFRELFSMWMRSSLVPTAAAALLAIGFFGGAYFERSKPSGGEDLTALRQELKTTRQMVALSMLQQQSASDRLEGVSFSRRLERPNPEVLGALLHTLRFDNSVDVRLAALDVLRHYTGEETVRAGVEDSLRQQQSPLVQIALVDFFVESRDRNAVDKLKALQQDSTLIPAVRQKVEWGITELSRG